MARKRTTSSKTTPKRALKKIRASRKAPAQKRRRRNSTRYLSSEPGTITISGGRIVIVLPRRLRSPNQVRSHWAYSNDRKAWSRELTRAIIMQDDGSRIPYTHLIADNVRVRVEIQRLAPSSRYMLDFDNLSFSGKRLQDALKEFEYIVDDNSRWIDGPYITQNLSTDKHYWAIITLTPLVGPLANAARVPLAKVDVRQEAERQLYKPALAGNGKTA